MQNAKCTIHDAWCIIYNVWCFPLFWTVPASAKAEFSFNPDFVPSPFALNSTLCTMFNGLKISFLFLWTMTRDFIITITALVTWPWWGRPGPRRNQWYCKARGSQGGGAGKFSGWGWQYRGEEYLVPREALYSQGAVANHKQDMVVYTILCIWWSSRKNYLTPSESSWRQTPNRLVMTFLCEEGWHSCIRISVLSPCMLSINYYCVNSVTVEWPECSDDGQDIDI